MQNISNHLKDMSKCQIKIKNAHEYGSLSTIWPITGSDPICGFAAGRKPLIMEKSLVRNKSRKDMENHEKFLNSGEGHIKIEALN